jgi:hypothetical protein
MLRVRASKCWSCGGLGSERRQTALTASGTRSTQVPLQGPDPEAQKGKWNHLQCSMSLSMSLCFGSVRRRSLHPARFDGSTREICMYYMYMYCKVCRQRSNLSLRCALAVVQPHALNVSERKRLNPREPPFPSLDQHGHIREAE